MREDVIDFIHGFSEAIIHGIDKARRNEIGQDIEKSKKKLILVAISVAIIGTGIFTAIWGIASYIDQRFEMQGLGFILVGIIAILIGALTIRVE